MLAVLGLAWQWAARTWPYLLPPLRKVGASLADSPAYYLRNAGDTLEEAAAGLAIGLVVAFALAVLISELPLVRRAVLPIAVDAERDAAGGDRAGRWSWRSGSVPLPRSSSPR